MVPACYCHGTGSWAGAAQSWPAVAIGEAPRRGPARDFTRNRGGTRQPSGLECPWAGAQGSTPLQRSRHRASACDGIGSAQCLVPAEPWQPAALPEQLVRRASAIRGSLRGRFARDILELARRTVSAVARGVAGGGIAADLARARLRRSDPAGALCQKDQGIRRQTRYAGVQCRDPGVVLFDARSRCTGCTRTIRSVRLPAT